MRKRNKTGRGSRALSARRGNSRVPASSRNNDSTTTSVSSTTRGPQRGTQQQQQQQRRKGADAFPDSGLSCLITAPSSTTVNGALHKPAIPERYWRNGISVGVGAAMLSVAGAVPTNPKNSDFYLHKKFKKLTTTAGGVGGEDGSSPPVCDMDEGLKPLQPPTPSLSPPTPRTNTSSNSPPNSTSSNYNSNNNNNNYDISSKATPSKCASNPYPPPTTTTSEPNKGTDQVVPNNIVSSNSSVVYKPKFRIALEASMAGEGGEGFRATPPTVNTTTTTTINTSTVHSLSSGSVMTDEMEMEQQLQLQQQQQQQQQERERERIHMPGKINGERRMDRQSLDDRISKIIHENQSILSTLREPWGKKRRQPSITTDQQQQQQQTPPPPSTPSSQQPLSTPDLGLPPNGLVIMSGGSASEGLLGLHRFSPATPIPGATITLRPRDTSAGSSPHLLPGSHTDAAAAAAAAAVAAAGHYLPSPSLRNPPTPAEDSLSADALLLQQSGSNSGSNPVVPKKRRRLSPTPNRLCGGEVAELPRDESCAPHGGAAAAAAGKSYYQDVDMTVRVSKCGTSGAKVTIRTNGSGSGVGGGSNFARFLDVPSSPLKLSSAVEPLGSGDTAGFFPGITHHLPFEGSKGSPLSTPSPLPPPPPPPPPPTASHSPSRDLKGAAGKPRGRPPKKSKLEMVSNLTRSPGPGSNGNNNTSSSCGPSPSSSPMPSVIVNGGGNGIVVKLPSSPPLPPKVAQVSPGPNPLGKAPLEVVLLTVKSEAGVEQQQQPAQEEEEEDEQEGGKISGWSGSSPHPLVLQSSAPNPKRPTFLALKPVNPWPKQTRLDGGVLPSPETPRGARTYSQMYINGQAYTYLGFKVSTRSSYTCLFKPQPMFLPQESDPKLSMYSNWQPRSRSKNQEEFLNISLNDSRVNGRRSPRSFIYTSAGRGCLTQTVDSPDQSKSILSLLDSFQLVGKGGTRPVSPPPTPIIAAAVPGTAAAAADRSDSLLIPASSPATTTATSAMGNNLKPSVVVVSSPVIVSPAASAARKSSVPTPLRYSSPPENLVNLKPLDLVENSNSGSTTNISSVPSSSRGGAIMTNHKEGMSSSSPASSSADESVNLTVDKFSRRDKPSGTTAGRKDRRERLEEEDEEEERPLALISPQDPQDLTSRESPPHEGDDDKSSSSYSNHFDNPRLRIMEGGFESNEDYTYVRGRGRGRYVCEACGIRCKKPSMLRKHLKTHTDLRPYTCKLCNFSFKTKGNLTKHQKSKSHHKKCLGLGIHPNSQRSLAMIGPQFSDTNSTDESEDEEDTGCYNGDTDSQDEIDPEEVSSSAEPEPGGVGGESQSFEKEIAQSLLDLSKVGRVSGGSSSLGVAVSGRASQLPSRASSSDRCGGARSTILEETSCSGESSTTAPDAPIDLSFRGRSSAALTTADGFQGDPKRFRIEKNINIRSFGVVGEAQRWEPEEEFMITGCLNLKKIPNDVNSGRRPGSHVPNNGNVLPTPADVKPEVRSLNLSNNSNSSSSNNNNNNNNVGERPYDFHLGKRKRESSVSSGYGAEPMLQSSRGGQLVAGSNVGPQPKQQKLHQPWLSPEEAKCSTDVILVKQDMESPRGRPPQPPPPPQDGDMYEQKVLDSCDMNREPGLVIGGGLEIPRPGAELSPTPKVFPGLAGLKPQAEFREPSGPQALVKDEGKAECNVCGKVFARASQLSLHMNIHYLERPFRCDPCGVSFRTKGHLIKHRRSSSHDCKVKVYLTDSWGVANEENPRPFKCPDCKIAFRIHGHLAKHLRSKMHIMRMECLGKLPFGIYFEMEKCGLNLTEIDTSDCDMSLISLQGVAKKIYGDSWTERLTVPMEESI